MEWQALSNNSHQSRSETRRGSFTLYNLYVNDLLVELENSGLGARVGDIFTGAPMYADDLALIASSPEELQGMLDIVQTYAQKWRYSLHPGKSKVMVFGSR